jgi:galactitol-specific phosphotransferase system IIB component
LLFCEAVLGELKKEETGIINVICTSEAGNLTVVQKDRIILLGMFQNQNELRKRILEFIQSYQDSL